MPAAGQSAPVIATTYDGLDQITKVTDPRALATEYSVDGLGNSTRIKSPDSGIADRTYDAAGNLLTATDPRQWRATHTYDALNRLTGIAFSKIGGPAAPATPSVGFNYDNVPPSAGSVGKLTSVTHGSTTVGWNYDVKGRIAVWQQLLTGGPTFTGQYAYSPNGQLLAQT